MWGAFANMLTIIRVLFNPSLTKSHEQRAKYRQRGSLWSKFGSRPTQNRTTTTESRCISKSIKGEHVIRKNMFFSVLFMFVPRICIHVHMWIFVSTAYLCVGHPRQSRSRLALHSSHIHLCFFHTHASVPPRPKLTNHHIWVCGRDSREFIRVSSISPFSMVSAFLVLICVASRRARNESSARRDVNIVGQTKTEAHTRKHTRWTHTHTPSQYTLPNTHQFSSSLNTELTLYIARG